MADLLHPGQLPFLQAMTILRLLIPGPIDLDQRVLAALAEPVIPHYGQPWLDLYRRLQQGVLRYAQTKGDAYIMASSGSGAIEAGVRSLTSPGDRVLVPINGYFSQRFFDIALANGLDARKMDIAPGSPPTPEQIAARIEAEQIKTLLLCHSETSCGAICPLEEIARVCRDRGVNIILDAVSSFAAVEIRTDEWGLDYLATASQKGLEGPPGLAPAIISPQGWDTLNARSGSAPGWYFDLATWRQFAATQADFHPQLSTMPVNVARALDVALQIQQSETPEQRFARTAKGAAEFRQNLRDLGFSMLAREDVASPTVTCALPPEDLLGGVDPLLAWLRRECGFVLAEGFGPLKGRIIRIGHMSRLVFDQYLPDLLDELERYLRQARTA